MAAPKATTKTNQAGISEACTAFFAALTPREPWTPSQWAERAPRILSSEETSAAGPWKNAQAPYLAGIMDAVARAGVQEVVVIKAAQVGYSECVRNVVGYWVDLDPGPCLVVMPDQKSAEDLQEERFDPLFANTPALSRHLTGRKKDNKKHKIKLDTMSLFFAWAGSSQGMKSRPVRYLLCEEPDEYPAISGTSGDPLSKGLKRITTYAATGRGRVLIGGTPTTRRGNVWKRWEQCGERYYFWCPCPHCGKYQQLVWGKPGGGPGVKWPKIEGDRRAQAAAIEAGDLAHYQCEHCPGEIHDHHKPAMLVAGVWAGEDQAVTEDGRVVGPEKPAKAIGFFLPGLLSPWLHFSALAAEWLLAQGDPQAVADFINQRLAEPYEEISAETKPDIIWLKVRDAKGEALKDAPAPLIAPPWVEAVFMTVDTQQDHFWWTIRAWGQQMRSRLLRYGIAVNFDELYSLAFAEAVPIEGGGKIPIAVQLIDRQGGREDEVDNYVLADPARLIPTFGSAHVWPGWPVRDKPHHKVTGARIWEMETNQLKNTLHRLIHDPDPLRWMPHVAIDDRYCRQLASEQRVWDPKAKRMVWKKKGPNHLWDTEVQQVAAATELLAGLVANVPDQKPAERRMRVPEWMKRDDRRPQ